METFDYTWRKNLRPVSVNVSPWWHTIWTRCDSNLKNTEHQKKHQKKSGDPVSCPCRKVVWSCSWLHSVLDELHPEKIHRSVSTNKHINPIGSVCMYAILMVTWTPSIYPSYVTINLPYIRIRHGKKNNSFHSYVRYSDGINGWFLIPWTSPWLFTARWRNPKKNTTPTIPTELRTMAFRISGTWWVPSCLNDGSNI